VIGWGSTHGAITTAVDEARNAGLDVASIHLRHLNPLPANLPDVLSRFRRFLVPELNLGHLSLLLRGRYLVDAKSLTKVQGQPFKVSEIRAAIEAVLRGEDPMQTAAKETRS